MDECRKYEKYGKQVIELNSNYYLKISERSL